MKRTLGFIIGLATLLSLQAATSAVAGSGADAVTAAAAPAGGKASDNGVSQGVLKKKALTWKQKQAAKGIGVSLAVGEDTLVSEGANIAGQAGKHYIRSFPGSRIFKDSSGNVYKMIPKGPKLPWNAGPDAIKAHIKKFGYNIARIGSDGSQKITDNLTRSWEVVKFGFDLYKIANNEKISPEEQEKQIYVSAIAAEVGIAVGSITGDALLVAMEGAGALSKIGAGVGVGLVAAWAMGEVKTAFNEYQAMWDAIEEAKKSEKESGAQLFRLGVDKMKQIKAALKTGNLKEAERLNDGLKGYTMKRMWGAHAPPGMMKLYEITCGFKNDIKRIRKEAKKRQIAEYEAKLKAWEAKQERKRREEAANKALFSISFKTSKSAVSPGDKFDIQITPLAGEPPFEISGDFTYSQRDRQTAHFGGNIEGTPGLYGYDIVAVDGKGRERTAHLSILITKPTEEELESEGHLEVWVWYEGADEPVGYSGSKINDRDGSRRIQRETPLFVRPGGVTVWLDGNTLSGGWVMDGEERKPLVVRHGVEKSYFENGAIASINTLRFGVAHGLEQYYEMDEGTRVLREETRFENGLQQESKAFSYEGKLEEHRRYLSYAPTKNDKDDCIYILKKFFDDRSHVGEATCYAGWEGKVKTFDKKGRLEGEAMYKMGWENGLQKQYFPSGNLKSEGVYVEGSAVGTHKDYYESGRIQLICKNSDSANPDCQCYDEEGEKSSCW